RSCRNQLWKVAIVIDGWRVRSSSRSERARGSAASISPSGISRSRRNVRAASSSTVASTWSHSRKRVAISRAALRVNVMARICEGAAPSRSRRTTRETSSHVLPLPAQASMTTLAAGARARAASSRPLWSVMPMILAAQAACFAVLARGRGALRRQLRPSRQRIEHGGEALLRPLRERLDVVGRRHGHYVLAIHGEIYRLGHGLAP